MGAQLGMGRRMAAGLAAVVLAMSAGNPAWADGVTDAAVNWITGKQVSAPAPAAGAFQWNPNDPAVYPNTQGATALGVLRAYQRTGNPLALQSALANGDCQLRGNGCIVGFEYADGDHRFATHDALFLMELSRISGDPQYEQFVDTELWSKFASSTYGADNDLDAAGYAAAVMTARSNQGLPQVVAFDLSKMAIAAHEAGHAAMRDSFMASILASLESADSSHRDYDLASLAAAIWASAETGVDLDPSSGTWAAAGSSAELAAMLTSFQAAGGGFVHDSSAAVIDANADPQVTALAMQALQIVDPVGYQSRVLAGFASLTGMQDGNGHFGNAYVEGQGEIMEAYADIVLAPATVYVDDDYAGGVFGSSESFTHPLINGGNPITVTFGQNAFASVGAAVQQVAAGGQVYVASGQYVEGNAALGHNLRLQKPVQLIGAQAGVDARNRSGNGASVIVPAVADPDLDVLYYGPYAVMRILANGVRVDGFVIDGDNPALSSGINIGGTDPDVQTGIQADACHHAEIVNNVIRNLVYAGFAGGSDAPTQGNRVQHNWIHNLDVPSTWGIGVVIYDNYYAAIEDNLIDGVRVGIQTNNFHAAAPQPADAVIMDNEIHASWRGIFFNQTRSQASTFTLAGNNVQATTGLGVTGTWKGIQVQSLKGDREVVIIGNHVDGSGAEADGRRSVGYLLNNITSSASGLFIDGGTISHVDVGVLATDAGFYAGPVEDFGVQNVLFSEIGLAAMYVEDTEQQTGTATLGIGTGNSYSNVVHELALSGSAPVVSGHAVDDVLVRAAGNDYFEPWLFPAHAPCATGCTTSNALIQDGIAAVAVGGTVHVEAGTFAEHVDIDKTMVLQGPFSGVSGYDASRDGSGEAVLSRTLKISAPDVKVDGMTLSGSSAAKVLYQGSNNDRFQFINNRALHAPQDFLLVANTADWEIRHNLFKDIAQYAVRAHGGTPRRMVVSDNHFVDVMAGVQMIENQSSRIIGNYFQQVSAYAIQVANSSQVDVRGNVIRDADLGVMLDHNNGGLALQCNDIEGNNYGIRVMDYIAPGSDAMAIWHNRVVAPKQLSTTWDAGQTLRIGSNYYDGAPLVVGTPDGASMQVAAPLPANPVGNAACGDNSATQLVVVSGDQQHALITSAFGSPLVVRVEDVLGGAVVGAPVHFNAPVAGASANLASATGSSDFNGIWSTTALANAKPGSYNVTAESTTNLGLATAVFTLHNEAAAASITIDPASLTAVYDGTAHGVTATTQPAGLAISVTYDGSATPPVHAGSYAVVASIADPSYVASTSGTLVIEPAAATISLSGLNPTWDGSPKPVTVTTSPAGLAVNVTYDGNSTAPSAVGSYQVIASITDPDYSGLAIASLQIIEAPLVDLGISITDNRSYAQYDENLAYVIVVENTGNQDVSGATISSYLPATVLPAPSVSWHCYQTGAASCVPQQGSGDLAAMADIPAGDSVVIILDAVVNIDPTLSSDRIETQVSIVAAGDAIHGNDTASDATQAVIFRDGFELHGDGAQVPMLLARKPGWTALNARGMQLLDVRKIKPGRMVELARLRSDDGDRARVEALVIGKQLRVRLVGHVQGKPVHSAWTLVAAQTQMLALGHVQTVNGGALVLAGGEQDLLLTWEPAGGGWQVSGGTPASP